MQLRKSTLTGLWILITINLLIAVGAIAVLNRMSPAIANIISENDQSLVACEDMLSILAISNHGKSRKNKANAFYDAFEKARENITEDKEGEALNRIRETSEKYFSEHREALPELVASIKTLASINREAMRKADGIASRMGKAGAWSVVFLGSASFLCGLIFSRFLQNRVITPIGEIQKTLRAQKEGDKFRRCSAADTNSYFYFIFEEINALIDVNAKQEK